MLLPVGLLAGHGARAQRPDTTPVHYTGTLTGALSAGGGSRPRLTTSQAASFNCGLHVGLPVNATFSFGKQERRLRERAGLVDATTPYY